MSHKYTRSGLRLQASLIAITSVITLTACGGGGSSSNGGAAPTAPVSMTPPPPPAPQGTSFSLDGTTTKGLILNGYVNVTDAADSAVSLVSGRTNATDGTYDVTIPASAAFSGPFVRVTVEGGPDAVMICDAGDGCLTSAGDTVAFGESFAIDETVSLSALVPTPANNQSETVNLTIFSDLAASLAESNGALTSESIDTANAQVSDLFGLLTTDPTELDALNIADAATSSSDENAIRAAILSGGVLGAALENGADIGTALENLRADFVANDGQLVINEAVDDPALISLEDILDESLNVTAESEIAGDAFEAAASEILGDSVTAAGSRAGEQTSASAAPSNMAPPLDQAKAFVADLQLIVEAVQSEETEDNFVEFAERVEDAAGLIDEEAESALDAALRASEAIALAYEAYQDDNSLTTFTENGFVVDVSSNAGDLSLVIAEQTVGEETVQMSVTGDLDVELSQVDEEEFSDNDTDTSDGIFQDSFSSETSTILTIGNDAIFSGRVENAAVLIDILGGEVSVRGGEFESTEIFSNETVENINTGRFDQTFEATDFFLLAAERVSASLDLNISEKRADGLAFAGMASASLVGGRFESNELSTLEFNGVSDEGLFFDTVNTQIESSDISFSGTFSEGGEFVNLSVAFQTDGAIELTTEGEREDLLTYGVSDNILTISHLLGDDTYEFVTHAAATAELASGDLGVLVFTNDDGVDLFRTSESNNLTAVSNIPNASAPVIRFETQLFRQQTGFTRTVFFLQTESIESILVDRSGWSRQFLNNPPTDILDYYNQGFIIEDTPRLSCLPNVNGSAYPNLYLIDDPILERSGSVIDGFDVFESFSDSNGVSRGSRCDPIVPGVFTASFAEIDNFTSFTPESSATGRFAASVSQNISGIDPDDSLVTASLFGPLSLTDGEVGGSLTLKLDFAGRTFQTDARSFNVFADLSEPVTITNQDEVMMTISEDANGDATGQVNLNGVVHGTITEDNGVILVTYTDNSFVSLQ